MSMCVSLLGEGTKATAALRSSQVLLKNGSPNASSRNQAGLERTSVMLSELRLASQSVPGPCVRSLRTPTSYSFGAVHRRSHCTASESAAPWQPLCFSLVECVNVQESRAERFARHLWLKDWLHMEKVEEDFKSEREPRGDPTTTAQHVRILEGSSAPKLQLRSWGAPHGQVRADGGHALSPKAATISPGWPSTSSPMLSDPQVPSSPRTLLNRRNDGAATLHWIALTENDLRQARGQQTGRASAELQTVRLMGRPVIHPVQSRLSPPDIVQAVSSTLCQPRAVTGLRGAFALQVGDDRGNAWFLQRHQRATPAKRARDEPNIDPVLAGEPSKNASGSGDGWELTAKKQRVADLVQATEPDAPGLASAMADTPIHEGGEGTAGPIGVVERVEELEPHDPPSDPGPSKPARGKRKANATPRRQRMPSKHAKVFRRSNASAYQCGVDGCKAILDNATSAAHVNSVHYSERAEREAIQMKKAGSPSAAGWNDIRCRHTVCEETVRTLSNLHRHLKTKHWGTSATKCPACDKILSRLDALKRHFETHHPGLSLSDYALNPAEGEDRDADGEVQGVTD
ncbi:hypothetical protein BC628DRAFT_1371325 [Trametes gibbosa]|uniref:Zinc finger protein 216 n=1 Tax=Trametes gibbosa TaxID=160864 RepID=A0A6B9KD24_9APHY|nr:hypothetical protein BC628DRAFT_1371325 [Trametes gibbosa]QHA24589.1 zinc finger protein 216 [Trametes gibbosa]